MFFSLISLKTKTLDFCPFHGAESSYGKFTEIGEEKKKKQYLPLSTWQPTDKPRGTAETPDTKSPIEKKRPHYSLHPGVMLRLPPPPPTLLPAHPWMSRIGLSIRVPGGAAPSGSCAVGLLCQRSGPCLCDPGQNVL